MSTGILPPGGNWDSLLDTVKEVVPIVANDERTRFEDMTENTLFERLSLFEE